MHPGACTTARVFVKGLTDDPAHADAPVAALFGSFGLRVTSMERLGPYKERVFYRSNGKRVRVRYGRRFAFLDVALPEDHVVAGKERDDDDDDDDDDDGDADEDGADGEQEGRVDVDASTVAFRNALQKAIRSLNGTTWKGATLRCQLAKERGDLRVLREIAEEAEAEAEGAGEGGGGEAGETSPRGTAVHEKENVNGENSVRFDDGEEEAGTEEGAGDDAAGWGARWAEIETPKQWVYNYERRLREVAAASNREGGGAGAGAGAGGGAGAGAGKSLVERFLEQEDEKRAKRREDREERAKESFGVVYEEGRKRAGGKRAREAPEAWEEARIAVVDFMTDDHDDDDDDDDDDDNDRGGNGGQGATRRPGGVDLSRFEDSSDSDEAMAIDANTDHDDHGRGDGAEEDDGEERDTTQSGDDSLGSGSDDDDDEGDAGRDEGDFDENDDDDERDDDENDDDTNDDNDENGRLEETLSKVFPNAAGFRAIVPPDQAQAQLNAQSDRIRTSLKTYRKKSRRLAAGGQK